jgi:hypothetical protein
MKYAKFGSKFAIKQSFSRKLNRLVFRVVRLKGYGNPDKLLFHPPLAKQGLSFDAAIKLYNFMEGA